MRRYASEYILIQREMTNKGDKETNRNSASGGLSRNHLQVLVPHLITWRKFYKLENGCSCGRQPSIIQQRMNKNFKKGLVKSLMMVDENMDSISIQGEYRYRENNQMIHKVFSLFFLERWQMGACNKYQHHSSWAKDVNATPCLFT